MIVTHLSHFCRLFIIFDNLLNQIRCYVECYVECVRLESTFLCYYTNTFSSYLVKHSKYADFGFFGYIQIGFFVVFERQICRFGFFDFPLQKLMFNFFLNILFCFAKQIVPFIINGLFLYFPKPYI